MQVVEGAPPVNHGAVLRRIRELRCNGATATPWQAVQHELALSNSELNSYRWLSAAQLKAEHPQISWAAVAADKSVDFKLSTLKSNHRSAKLPTGQSWGEYVSAFQEAQRARLEALQQSRGIEAAEELYEIFSQGKRVLAAVQANLLDHIENPPKTYGVPGLKGMVQVPVHDKIEQQLIEFPGMEPVEVRPARERRSLSYDEKLLTLQGEVFKAGQIAARLLVGLKPEDDEQSGEDGGLMSVEEFVARRAALDERLEKLRQFAEGAA